jgi:hypothetical protein
MWQVDVGSTMTTSVVKILPLVETLGRRLMEPADDEMRAVGWRDESSVTMTETLDKLAAKIRLVAELPAMSERPWDTPRGLDSLRIHGGDPYDEQLAFGRTLRQAP